MVTVDVSKYAVTTQAYCVKPFRSARMCGAAVPTTVWSNAVSNCPSSIPISSITSRMRLARSEGGVADVASAAVSRGTGGDDSVCMAWVLFYGDRGTQETQHGRDVGQG